MPVVKKHTKKTEGVSCLLSQREREREREERERERERERESRAELYMHLFCARTPADFKMKSTVCSSLETAVPMSTWTAAADSPFCPSHATGKAKNQPERERERGGGGREGKGGRGGVGKERAVLRTRVLRLKIATHFKFNNNAAFVCARVLHFHVLNTFQATATLFQRRRLSRVCLGICPAFWTITSG